MNAKDLISKISVATDLPKTAVSKVLDELTLTIKEVLNQGDEVTLPNLGKFKTSTRAARTGRNPQSGAAMQIAASTTPKFVASSVLKKALN